MTAEYRCVTLKNVFNYCKKSKTKKFRAYDFQNPFPADNLIRYKTKQSPNILSLQDGDIWRLFRFIFPAKKIVIWVKSNLPSKKEKCIHEGIRDQVTFYIFALPVGC